MQTLLKWMINCVSPSYIQHLDQYLQWLGENFKIDCGLPLSSQVHST